MFLIACFFKLVAKFGSHTQNLAFQTAEVSDKKQRNMDETSKNLLEML